MHAQESVAKYFWYSTMPFFGLMTPHSRFGVTARPCLAQIRYIEEYTREEWAQEAAFLRQKALAKQIIESMNNLVSALEDALVQKALETGSSLSMSYTVQSTNCRNNKELLYL